MKFGQLQEDFIESFLSNDFKSVILETGQRQ